jgi:hypothetical protein
LAWTLIITFKKMLKKPAILFLFFLFFTVFHPKLTNASNEITTVLYPVADSFINSNFPSQIRGNDTAIVVKRDLREPIVYIWGLIRFDLTDIPENAQISQAVIRLHQLNTEEGGIIKNRSTITMLRITQPWKERTVAWFNKPNFSEEGAISTSLTDQIKHYDWDATELMKSWVNKQVSNHGVYLQVTSQTYHQWQSTFGSREDEPPPELIVTYTVPEQQQEQDPPQASPTEKPDELPEVSQQATAPTPTLSPTTQPTQPTEPVETTLATHDELVETEQSIMNETAMIEDDTEENSPEELLEQILTDDESDEINPDYQATLSATSDKTNRLNNQQMMAVALLLMSAGALLSAIVIKEIRQKKKQGFSFKKILRQELRTVKSFFGKKKNAGDEALEMEMEK